MRRAHLDFTRRFPAPRPWAIALFAAGALAAAVALYRHGEEQLRHERAVADAARAREVSARGAAAPAPRVPTIAPAQAAAVNAAVALLNLPWPELLGALERARPADVALVALEPEARRGLLRITAEARDATAMLAFFEALRDVALFTEVNLGRHEARAQEGGALRFSLEARWKEAR